MTELSKENPVDLEFLKSVIDDDAEFQKELFAIFIENAHRNVEKMEDAMERLNNNSWYMASHAFKGASASIGAMKLAEMLEHAQKNPEETTEQKSVLLNQVKEELDLVIQFLEKISN